MGVDFKPKEKTKEKAPQVETIKPVDETTPIPVSPSVKPLEAGQVVITVYKAKDIEKKGKLGKADPYVKITLGKQKAKSSTVKNNHNPEWNLKATFGVDQNITEGINIEVFDDDLGKDDSLGSTFIDISKVQEHHQFLNQWIPLEKCKSGEVFLSVEFIPLSMVQQQNEVEPLIAAEQINETVLEVDFDTKEKRKEKAPEDKTSEVAVVQQQKEVEKLIVAETIKESEQEVKLVPKETNKEKATQEKTLEPAVETKPVSVSLPQKILEAGQVVITVYKARDIEKKGMFGKADPYVKMTLGKQKAKSATVKTI